MRQIIPARTYRAMYRLLDRVSPIDGDCGRLCGSICCTAECSARPEENPKSSDNILLQQNGVVNQQQTPALSYSDGENEDEQTLGIYLYPGEESLFICTDSVADTSTFSHTPGESSREPILQYPAHGKPRFIFEAEDAEEYEYPDSWTGDVWFARCTQVSEDGRTIRCERGMRPLQCRFYPAAPHFNRRGQLTLIYFPAETPYRCPLIEERFSINRDFLQATYTVCLHLLRDPQVYDLFLFDSAWRREDPDFDEEALRLYP